MHVAAAPNDGGKYELRGRHVLVAVLAFFGVIFAVNGYFLYAALSTHGGVVAVEPYRKGLAYNDRIAAEVRQQANGWTGAFDVAENGTVTLDLRRDDGNPLTGRHVVAVVGRPATTGFDATLTLRETLPGRYQTTVKPFAPGNWIASIEVRERAELEPSFRMRRRLWLKH
jgi:nitrogen fixation protein FixH